MTTINELVIEYPDVDWGSVDREVLVEIAKLYLSEQRRKLYDNVPVTNYTPGEAKEILERRTRAQQQRKREKTKEIIASNREKVNSAVANRINEITRSYAETILNKWVPDLLDSTFALPDGSRVRWADATVAQHEERADFLEMTASENTKTASMHRRAVNDIRSAGAKTLGSAITEKEAA